MPIVAFLSSHGVSLLDVPDERDEYTRVETIQQDSIALGLRGVSIFGSQQLPVRRTFRRVDRTSYVEREEVGA